MELFQPKRKLKREIFSTKTKKIETVINFLEMKGISSEIRETSANSTDEDIYISTHIFQIFG